MVLLFHTNMRICLCQGYLALEAEPTAAPGTFHTGPHFDNDMLAALPSIVKLTLIVKLVQFELLIIKLPHQKSPGAHCNTLRPMLRQASTTC